VYSLSSVRIITIKIVHRLPAELQNVSVRSGHCQENLFQTQSSCNMYLQYETVTVLIYVIGMWFVML